MTRGEAIKTLKENYCSMCAYGSQDMDSCDIRSCDNKDAIKALEQIRLTINIPDLPNDQCFIDISLHFQEGQLVEYTAPSGWFVEEQLAWMPLSEPYKEEKEYKTKAITRGNCMICGKELTEGLFFCKECEDKEVEE